MAIYSSNLFSLYLSILISFVFFQMPIISSTKNIEKDIEEILGPDYLNNLPSEDYIIGPGDKLKIVVSREYEELTTLRMLMVKEPFIYQN